MLEQTQLHGCGVDDHTAECLCDVVVKHPIEINPNFTKGWFVDEIVEFGKHNLNNPDGLLRFLCEWTAVHDEFVARQTASNDGWYRSRNEPWRLYAKDRFINDPDVRVATVRAEVLEKFGVELSRSNASHIKRRSLLKGAA